MEGIEQKGEEVKEETTSKEPAEGAQMAGEAKQQKPRVSSTPPQLRL